MARLRPFIACVLCAALAAGICGCPKFGAKTKTTPAAGSSMVGSPGPDSFAPDPSTKLPDKAVAGTVMTRNGITLKVVDPAGLEEFVKEHKGKVVLVDFWALWCVPCLKSYPHTVEMNKTYKDKGFVAASMCMMEPEGSTLKDVLEKLKDLKSDMPNFLSALGGEDTAYEAFKIVNLPHYRIYDREGKAVLDLDNSDPDHPIDYTDVEKAVKKELGL